MKTTNNCIAGNQCYCYDQKNTKQNLNGSNIVICITLPMGIRMKESEFFVIVRILVTTDHSSFLLVNDKIFSGIKGKVDRHFNSMQHLLLNSFHSRGRRSCREYDNSMLKGQVEFNIYLRKGAISI